ncbi:MAG: hypothetical protein ACTSWI_04585 [Alphaproteobacteria bacterium]
MSTSRAADPQRDQTEGAPHRGGAGTDVGNDAYWGPLLRGEDRRLERLRGVLARLPDAPRCKICSAPFAGWGNLVSRGIGRQRASTQMTLCRNCHARITQHRGAAEVDATIIIAEFRGGRAPESERENKHFKRLVGRAINHHGGVLEKIDADHLRAFFVTWSAGENHVERAVDASRDLFTVARDDRDGGGWIGVGLHTGRAHVGTVRDRDRIDFGAVGPIVNVTEKLAAAAPAGEALVSLAAWRRQGGPVAKSRQRSVPIPGELQPIDAVVVRGDIEAKL